MTFSFPRRHSLSAVKLNETNSDTLIVFADGYAKGYEPFHVHAEHEDLLQVSSSLSAADGVIKSMSQAQFNGWMATAKAFIEVNEEVSERERSKYTALSQFIRTHNLFVFDNRQTWCGWIEDGEWIVEDVFLDDDHRTHQPLAYERQVELSVQMNYRMPAPLAYGKFTDIDWDKLNGPLIVRPDKTYRDIETEQWAQWVS